MKSARLWVRITTIVLVLVLMSATLIGAGCAPKKEEAKFPTKPIQLIITWPAGGASDLATRMLGKYAEKELGQAVTPVNLDGANGATGWAEAAKARPDGYTVVMVTFDILTNQALGRSPIKYSDFDYLLQFTSQPLGIVVRSESPYKTLDDLLKAAKEKPSTIKVSTTPLGGVYHQALALVEKASGAKFRIVPFPGSNEVNAALLGKQVDVQVNTLPLLDQYVKNGDFRILAVTSEKRVSRFPDVPTLKELKYDVVYESFRAIAVPKGVPAKVKKTLSDAFHKAYNNPEYQDAANKGKHDIYYRTGEDFLKFAGSLYPKVAGVLNDLGMIKK